MTTKEADKYGEIAQALKQIEAETAARVNGMPLEDPQPTEAPADIDFTGMYGYPCGYSMDASKAKYVGEYLGVPVYELKSLAHPEWPYTGTPHEWRVRIK